MFEVFGFPIYSVKKCLFSEMKLQESQHLNVNLKLLADHKEMKTAMIYAKGGELAKIKLLKDRLKVPNLTI